MKLRSRRGPICPAASDSAAMVMENTVPATPMVDEAMAPNSVRAPGAAAVVEPRAVEQPLGNEAASIEMNEADRGQHAGQNHQRWNQPKRVAQIVEQFANACGQKRLVFIPSTGTACRLVGCCPAKSEVQRSGEIENPIETEASPCLQL